MAKHILLFAHLGKGHGGGETTFEIIRGGLKHCGHQVTAVYNTKQDNKFWGVTSEYGDYSAPIALPNWWRHLLRPRGIAQVLSAFVGAIRILRAELPDVVYLHYFSLSALVFALLKSVFGYRFVIGCRGTDIEDMHGLKKKSASFILNRADAITCVSEAQKTEMYRQVDVTTPVYTIYNGVDMSVWEGDTERVTRGQNVISVGATRYEKGHDILIQAFSKVLDQYPKATLTIVGDGSYREPCEQLINELAIRDSVEITGWLPREKVRDRLHEAQLFAFPSRQEAFGMALLEAMASGLPVVATRTEGIPEVTEGTNALLVDPEQPLQLAEALKEALGNEGWRGHAAKESQNRARQLSLDAMIKQYEMVIAGKE